MHLSALPDPPEKNDPLIDRCLLINEGSSRKSCLDHLIESIVHPLAKSIVSRRMGYGSHHKDDAEDVEMTAVAKVAKKLVELSSLPEGKPIKDLKSYTAVVAHSTFSGYLRERHPRRALLYVQVKSAIDRQNGLARWPSKNGVETAGFEAWRGEQAAQYSRVNRLLESPENSIDEALSPESAKDLGLSTTIAKVLNWIGGPLELDVLVTALEAVIPAQGLVTRSDESEIENHPDRQKDPTDLHDLRTRLLAAWEEIQQLPPLQRKALILNAASPNGDCTVFLYKLLGVTSSQLCECLEISESELLELEERLPMQDGEIASMLGIRVDQVIGLRRAARERLARRLKNREN